MKDRCAHFDGHIRLYWQGDLIKDSAFDRTCRPALREETGINVYGFGWVALHEVVSRETELFILY